MSKKDRTQGQSLLGGAMLLMITTVIVHVIGIIYKIPITAILGPVGRGYFTNAYEIYTPLYAISMAGLPVALSKMVSERMATGRFKEVHAVRKEAQKLYLITGMTGTIILWALAWPYTHAAVGSIHTPEAFWSIMMIAPSILFACMMSSYRGYYEGLRNMAPTGYSQVFETIGKLVFGLILAKWVQIHGLSQFEQGKAVYGTVCKTGEEAASAIAPFSAAAAILGVTLGTILGLIYLVIRHYVIGDGITPQMLEGSPEPESGKSLRSQIIKFAIPVVTSSLVLNVTNLIDSWTVNNRVKAAVDKAPEVFHQMYQVQLAASNVVDKDIKSYLYGAYGVALDFRNLIPTIIMTLGLSAIPVLSGAWATKDHEKMRSSISTVLKTATLLAVPTGFVMAVLAEPVLRILYVGTNAESSITISAPFVAIYGYFALLLSISTPITNMLQAIGRADVPLKALAVGASLKIICNFTLCGMPSINIKGAPVGTIVCYLYIVTHNLIVLLKETKVKVDWVNVVLKPFAAGALSGGVAWGVYQLFVRILPVGAPGSRMAGFTWATLIALTVSILAWLVFLGLLKVLTKHDIESLPKGKKVAKVLEKLHVIG
ncbi:MAG: polysaccharide biosynthesis protein [Acutalibacteraceae bacterium]|nr:polysaccharide biosynthesis protein [Clostridia bacterium]MEE1292050.1 polysaccharide biosynthesis protein [Acutalibacteraceae bacterium]NLD29716.1 polysaccharide biosynthesis protein [Clostridiales bacterium]MBQ1528925.1 polysaccharide biosynthesis protein [Clostridia bacterium]MBQ5581685.1 polysaccharide biosynthesis protein [Clostridia bacterium]